MCGIAGIINLNGEKSLLVPPIQRMAKQMRRRGPDDEGYLLVDLENRCVYPFYGDDTPLAEAGANAAGMKHIKDAYQMESHLAFGHRRLKILDLSFKGHQPMCSSDGQFWIVYNGEVYNFKEVRKELEKQGHTFSSDTDTEVVLAAYMQWGVDSIQRFNGMFAVVIFDHSRQEVFLARDRIGIKPLYYTHQKDCLIFASDIKTIIASGLYRPGVNWEGLWHNLSFSVTPRPMTVFRDVVALPQAHWMKINLTTQNIIQQRYWHIPTLSQQESMTEQEAIEQLEMHLKKSIQYRLVADVEVGTFMSGGIDSTTISAIASSLHPGINAFTLAFDKTVPEYDELDQAVETARMHPMHHVIEKVSPDEVLTDIHDMVLGYEEPICTLAPNYLICKCIAKHGIVVVLNGLGGDELFAGYSHYRTVDTWKWKKFAAVIFPQFLGRYSRYRQLKTIDNYYVDQYSNFKEQEKKKLFLKNNGFDTLTLPGKLYKSLTGSFTDDIEALSYFDIMSYIGNHHVYRIDQFTMWFSLEGRFPYLDHHLIELAFRIPSCYKIMKNHPRYQKYVLRRVAEKYIAPACLQMPKRGFGLPVGRWMQKELKELTETSLESLKKRDIFNNKRIDELYNTFKQGKPHLYKKVWHLVMVELWYQQFIDKSFF
jgi:asparagine synthase (glutamine-hydrolysing)